MKKKMEAKEITAIMMTMIGEIKPTGDIQTDKERLQNLSIVGDIVLDLVIQIGKVGAMSISTDQSEKIVGKAAKWYLTKLEERLHKINEILEIAGAE